MAGGAVQLVHPESGLPGEEPASVGGDPGREPTGVCMELSEEKS